MRKIGDSIVAARRRCGTLGRALLVATGGVTARRCPRSSSSIDAATTARNSTTAALKELLYRLQRSAARKDPRHGASVERPHEPAEIHAWTTCRAGGRTAAPDFLFASGYLDALTFGDPGGAAYNRLAAAVGAVSPTWRSLPPRRTTADHLATGQRRPR